ncbi:methyltransferase [Symbioplanes lichenis]|uniref:methyltransferase n=1 Tax=Symbioplanes lichenis TaxID=1629072 RepID=UPI00273A439E|nr:methyltransferase [Actinoplanes lichenis]
MADVDMRRAALPPPPAFDLTRPEAGFRPLAGGAFPVAQDRWERLVTVASIPEPVGRVWEALVEPEHVARWLGVCHGGWARRGLESTLDFEDGEFFYCSTSRARPPTPAREGLLEYLWRWVGVGPAARVTWTVAPGAGATVVTVVEEATNPPSDWRSWNGMGWPGILDQLAGYLRTGTNTRWPWRRMGPYLQIPLPEMPFAAWEALTSPGAVKHWLQRSAGSLTPGDPMTMVMGDASGTIQLSVTKAVDAGQEFPSYQPYLDFELRRPAWTAALGGRMWIEPAGLGESLLQVFHYDWERLDIRDPVTERKLLTNHWINAAARARMLFAPSGPAAGPHGWSASATAPADRNGHSPQSLPADLDPREAGAFAGRVLGDLGAATGSLLAALGVRLGLFEALAAGPATPGELAERAGCAERYVTEWCWGLHSAGYLRHDRGTGRFVLPAEHAAVLAYAGSPFDLSPGYGLLAPMAAMLDEVADAFRSGKGIAADRYPAGLHAAMEAMSAQWIDGLLVDRWLPAVDGLTAALSRGAAVADVGSGNGRALRVLARRFPESRFIGYDLSAPAVDRATAAAAEEGLADRIRYVTADAADALDGPADLITMFDVLHDAPDPPRLLAAARAALAPHGALLVLESNGAADPEDNAGPAGPILYATSALYCVPTALAVGGPAPGTLGMPYPEVTRLGGEAGFTRIDELPVDSPMHALYVLRP